MKSNNNNLFTGAFIVSAQSNRVRVIVNPMQLSTNECRRGL